MSNTVYTNVFFYCSETFVERHWYAEFSSPCCFWNPLFCSMEDIHTLQIRLSRLLGLASPFYSEKSAHLVSDKIYL
eukprot:114083-Amphidinium_carterae.1